MLWPDQNNTRAGLVSYRACLPGLSQFKRAYAIPDEQKKASFGSPLFRSPPHIFAEWRWYFLQNIPKASSIRET